MTTSLVEAVKEALHIGMPESTPKAAASGETMRAVVYHSTKDVRVDDVPKPAVTDPTDAIVKITTTTICGSDLHLYHSFIPEMKTGDIIGHEFVGIVESVGGQVTKVNLGGRVCVSAVIACGKCDFCRKKQFSLCDTTNQSKSMNYMYGHRTAGLFGYSHMTGGYAGGQAEYARVPYADINLLHLPESVPDAFAVLIADVLCTAWHAVELAEVKQGDTVAIWGCGPIGLATAMWAHHLGARRVISIDAVPERLAHATALGGEVINYKQDPEVVAKLAELVPGGPDVCIEAAGSRYASSWQHTIQKALYLETDTIDTVTQAFYPIGAQMEKWLTVRGGQLWVQKDWHMVLDKLVKKEIDQSFMITHTMDLEDTSKAYKMFDKKEDGVLKVMLKPKHAGKPAGFGSGDVAPAMTTA
ncbi:hypothetical protein AMAG_03701 [Allomyces macrogynus ATCC 38327]|uniref:Chlorophyll synthesis pathway protein BchC n=1 Tax=Allomyces macrogynus (strain ATCC 38327) TaxID=578462 RepID=A0A0L0SAF9_ALLM3|nr:hypothetical protein AMAG_03701 [Allomyces macrogynus ATCC 38327]|eukprot:KNE59422.1 hypothetical protein AMAG_03701 [Allomyces macrogynus ATCC 38327]